MPEIRGLAALIAAVVPGLVVTAGLFRGVRLPPAERVATSLGLGVAVVVIVGVGLAGAGVALDATSWLLALGLATLGGVLLWLWPGRPARRAPGDPARTWRWTRGSTLRAAGFAAAAALAVGGLAVAHQAALDQPYPSYTAFWGVPEGASLAVGIRSAEAEPVTYHVVITAGSTRVAEWPALTLAPGQEWTGRATTPTTGPIEADLYRAGDDKPYRHVSWPVAPGASAGAAPSLPAVPSPTAPSP